MRRSWFGGRRRARDKGAAAVEFALVVPLLLAFVFGIVNYGFWFNDSLSVRQGVREEARGAVVLNPSAGCSGTMGMAAFGCQTKAQMGTIGSARYAKVWAPNGWARGNKLVVCGMVQSVSFTSLVPLPADGLIKSKTVMSIENVSSEPNMTGFEDTAPSGSNWTWCTA